MESKQCPTCPEKTRSAFSTNPSRHDGLSSHCRACVRKNYKKYKVKILKSKQAYYLNNIEELKNYKKKYYKNSTHIRSTPEYKKRKKLMDKISHFKRNYGLSLKRLAQMKKEQKNKCAICKKRPKGQKLHVDHCHKTGVVRALLCRSCNLGIGFLKDCPINLRNAIKYLARNFK